MIAIFRHLQLAYTLIEPEYGGGQSKCRGFCVHLVTYDGNQPTMSKLSPPRQDSSSKQAQVNRTNLILQDQTEQVAGLISAHIPSIVFAIS